jgi:hypothetical protein
MRALRILAVLIAGLTVFAGDAAAMPSPYRAGRSAPSINDSAIYLGPAGALLEADYFRAAHPRYGARRLLPCGSRLHLAAPPQDVERSCD